MRSEILGLLDKADMAIAFCVGVVHDDVLEAVSRAVFNARVRVSYPEEVLVVALVGGTGSGKSSLANALTGSQAAQVGGLRPTTDFPMALVPVSMESRLAGYLEAIGVDLIEVQESADRLCVLDMPDTDSVELEHRHQVDALLPRVDLIIWVLDPEKYRDAALHHRYLARLAPYAGQFVFVLNQGDRLSTHELDSVVADLQAALVEDGIGSGTVFVTSANPPSGPPIGVDQLNDHLERVAKSRTGLYDKLLVDMEETVADLVEATGGGGLDFRARFGPVIAEAAGFVASGLTGKAVDALKGFAEELAEEAGAPTRTRILDTSATIPGRVQTAYEAVIAITPNRRPWKLRWWKSDTAEKERLVEASRVLDELIGRPLIELLGLRARANAALADMALSIAAVKARR